MKTSCRNWLTLALTSAALVAMATSCTVDPRRQGVSKNNNEDAGANNNNNMNGQNPLDAGMNMQVGDTGGSANNCNDNPSMCVPHELMGNPPGCSCLGVCEQGWQWQNGACVQNGMMGNPDGGTGPVPSVDGGVPATDPFDPAALATTYANTVCARRTRCDPAIYDFFSTNEMECVADFTAQVTATYSAFGNIIAANRLGFSQTQFNNCMQAIQTADCVLGITDNACDGIFTGSQGTGQPCALQAECSDGNFCAIQRLGDCATCQRNAIAGADCAGSVCESGTQCLPLNDGRSLCIPNTAGEGQACGQITTGLCRGRLQCVGAMSGACARPVNRGDMCPTPPAMGAPATAGCNIYQNDVCVNNVCVAVNWGGAGSACGDTASPNNCNGSGYCNTTTMQCDGYPGMGAMCYMERCADGHFCDLAGSCQPEKTSGASCMASGECGDNLWCVSGSCGTYSYAFCP